MLRRPEIKPEFRPEGQTGQLDDEGEKTLAQERAEGPDGLGFICEVCGDQEGGCAECGFGAKQAKAEKEV